MSYLVPGMTALPHLEHGTGSIAPNTATQRLRSALVQCFRWCLLIPDRPLIRDPVPIAL
jgi:hypothetical protein